jgi:hypothetical protein
MPRATLGNWPRARAEQWLSLRLQLCKAILQQA